jgi:hypothetical protein
VAWCAACAGVSSRVHARLWRSCSRWLTGCAV